MLTIGLCPGRKKKKFSTISYPLNGIKAKKNKNYTHVCRHENPMNEKEEI